MNNYQSDEQFTEKGWGNMKELLDQEMPVQKKKRRGVFWLFLGLGLVAAGILWAIFPKESEVQNAVEETAVLAQNIPSAEGAVFSKAADDSKELQKNEISNTTNITNSLVTKKNSAGSRNVDSESFGGQIEKVNSVISKNSNLENSETGGGNNLTFGSGNISQPSDSNEEVYLEKENLVTNQNGGEGNLFLENVAEDLSKNENLEIEKLALAKLEASTLFLTPNQSQKSIDGIIEESEVEEKTINRNSISKRKIETGIYVGALLDFANTKKIGAFGGGFINFPIGKKLGFQTGLGYSLLQKNALYRFSDNYFAPLNQETTTQYPQGSGEVVQSETRFVLEKMHYLDLPLLLTYQVHPKWQLQGGFSLSYLLKKELSFVANNLNILEDLNSGAINTPFGLDQLDLSSIEADQFQKEDFWNNVDMSAVFGVSWKPLKRWNITLQGNLGMLTYINSVENNEGEPDEIILSFADLSSGYSVYPEQFGLQDFSPITTNNAIRYADLNTSPLIKNLGSYNYSIRLSVGYNF